MVELTEVPERWRAPTACTGWEVRDMIGHLVDATESCVAGFARARAGVDRDDAPIGLENSASAYDEAARAFRSMTRTEVLGRYHESTLRLLDEFEGLTDADWHAAVPERHLGSVPACFFFVGLLAGYAVHCWDVRQGLGLSRPIDGDTADLVVGFVPYLLSANANTDDVDETFVVTLRTTGRNGGDAHCVVSADGLRFHREPAAESDAVLEFDPGSLILRAYGRVDTGTIRGNHGSASRFLGLLGPI